MLHRLLGTSAFAALITASGAWAQDPAPGEDEATRDIIMVTAQKREQDILVTPLAVSAYDTEFLDDEFIRDPRDVADRAPNVAGNGQTIRGIGPNGLGITLDNPVQIYVDGVPTTTTGGGLEGIAFQTVDLERIEVLRGPQGTLYGRNTTAGAINIYTKRPNLDEFEGFIDGEYGANDAYLLRSSINVPLAQGTAAFRVGGYYAHEDARSRNIILDRPADPREEYGVRASLEFQAGPSTNIRIIGDIADRETGFAPVTLNGADPFEIEITNETISDFINIFNTESAGVSATLDHEFNDAWSLSSVSAYRTNELVRDADFDGFPVPIARIRLEADGEQYTHETRLNYNSETIQFTGGVFAYYSDVDLLRPVVALNPPVIEDQRARTKALAAFGQGEWYITDRLSLLGGLRVGWEEKEYDRIQALPDGTPTLPGGSQNVVEDWTNVSPKFGVNFEVNNDLFLYANAGHGFRSGGIATLNPDNVFDEENLWAYEAGLRSRLHDSLRFFATAFYYDYDDLQVSIADPADPSGTTFITANAASAEMWGLEFELNWRPTDALLLEGAVGVLEGEFGDFIQNPNDPSTDFSGNSLPGAPAMTAYVAAQYDLSLGEFGTLTPRVTMERRGEAFSDAANTQRSEPSTIFSAYLSYETPSRDWYARAQWRNFNEERFVTFITGNVVVLNEMDVWSFQIGRRF